MLGDGVEQDFNLAYELALVAAQQKMLTQFLPLERCITWVGGGAKTISRHSNTSLQRLN